MKRMLARMKFHLVLAGLFLACAPGSPPLAMADETPANSTDSAATATKSVKTAKPAASDKTTPKKSAAAGPIAAEREAAAIEFAQQNHPELVSLLQNLKQSAPKEYQAALVDLDRTFDRLSKLKEKSPDRYESQLSDWKMTSRVRLLAARLAVSNDPSVESELRAILRQRLEARLAAQRADRDRLQKRVEKLDQAIDEMASKMDAQVEKQFAELHKAPPAPKTTAKSKTKKPSTAVSVDVKEQK